MHMPRMLPEGLGRERGGVQLLQDAAGVRRFGPAALQTQRLQLLLERLQLRDARGHVADVVVQQLVDLTAIVLRRIAEFQQAADFVERHVQRTAAPDEAQALGMLVVVDAVVAVGAGGLGQQLLALVVADGFTGVFATLASSPIFMMRQIQKWKFGV